MYTKIFDINSINEFSLLNNLSEDQYNELESTLKYFNICDFRQSYDSEYDNSKRFIVCYNKDTVLGICYLAKFNFSTKYLTLSYLSVNNKFQNQGICKSIINKLMELMKTEFPNEPLATSQWSVKGWKYLRPTILKSCELNNISFIDNKIGFCDDNEYPEMFELIKQNKFEY